MGRKFKLWKDPYDCGIDLYKKKTIEIKPGVTVLVGCNGIGKTTLLHCIKDSLKKEKIPCMEFNNLIEGGSNSRQESLYKGDFSFLTTSACSSEGENIMLNITKLAVKIGEFVRTGIYQGDVKTLAKRFQKSIGFDNESLEVQSNERWILFDAVDSGLSVDNIVELKEDLFRIILEHSFGKEIYIVISANEYEMANSEQCLDVYNGKYLTFKNYDEYRNMILESRKWKEKRTSGNR